MKKSRIAKLALMGASITALAATLTTSTYAWYVSNKTATVATANGQTAASAADGSILLSWTGKDDTWFKELTWADAGAPTTFDNSTNKLSPVYFNATDKKFYGLTDGDDADSNPDEVNSGYYTFSLFIKADKNATTVTPTVTMSNTTSVQSMNSAKQIAYVATGAISKGASFVVDAFDAMYYSLSVDGGDPTVVAAPTAGKFNTVHANDDPAVTVTTQTPGAAHTYYTDVTGEELPTGYNVEPVTGTISNLTVGETAVKLTWTIWLAGNDVDCYNSCAAQNFSFALTFQA